MNHKFVVRTKARQFVHEYAKSIGRGDVIQLVSKEFLDSLDSVVEESIKKKVRMHPSGFRTLK